VLVGAEPYYHLDGPVRATEARAGAHRDEDRDLDCSRSRGIRLVVLSWAAAHEPDPSGQRQRRRDCAGPPGRQHGTRLITTALHELERRDASTRWYHVRGRRAVTGTILERL